MKTRQKLLLIKVIKREFDAAIKATFAGDLRKSAESCEKVDQCCDLLESEIKREDERKLPKSEAEAAGLSCQPKADPVAISKLFDDVKPYEPMPK